MNDEPVAGEVAHPLCPYRFSERPEEMIRFLETLGLVRRVTAGGEFYGELAAAEGSVAVHGVTPERPADTGASPGETQLSFVTGDARGTADRLEQSGLRSLWWDESYGRHAAVTGPHGEGVRFTEDGDRHGYREHAGDVPASGLRVVAVRGCEDRPADVDFFARLGYVPDWSRSSAGWMPLEGVGGVIGLHGLVGDVPAPAAEVPAGAHNPGGRIATARLGFETAEDLDALRRRLVAAGYAAERRGGPDPAVIVEDPDGMRVEIHPR